MYIWPIYIYISYTYSNGNYSFRHIVNRGMPFWGTKPVMFSPLAKVRPTMCWSVSYWKWDTDSPIAAFPGCLFSHVGAWSSLSKYVVFPEIYSLYMVLMMVFHRTKNWMSQNTQKLVNAWGLEGVLSFISRLLLFGVTSLNLRHQATVPTLHRVSSGRSFHQLEP